MRRDHRAVSRIRKIIVHWREHEFCSDAQQTCNRLIKVAIDTYAREMMRLALCDGRDAFCTSQKRRGQYELKAALMPKDVTRLASLWLGSNLTAIPELFFLPPLRAVSARRPCTLVSA